MDTFRFDVALLITITITKKSSFFSYLLFTHLGKNLCKAQKQANASLLVTGALQLRAHCCGSRFTLSCKSSLSEGSLGLLLFFLVYKYNKPVFYSHAVPSTFSLLVQCLTSAVSSFQPSFLENRRKKKQKTNLWFILFAEPSVCVHCKLTVRVVALIRVHGDRVSCRSIKAF